MLRASSALAIALVAIACTSRPATTVSPGAPAPSESVALLPALRVAADSLLAINRPQGGGTVWADLSDSTRLRGRVRVDRVADMLHAVDRKTLSQPSDQLLYDNLRESVDASVGARMCRTYLWAIS